MEHPSNRKRDILLVFGLTACLAGMAWLAGFVTALYVSPPGPPVPADVAAPSNFGLFAEVWRTVDHEFYGERPAPKEVTYHAIDGMVDALEDPYAAFLDRDSAEKLAGDIAPEMVSGIGAWVEPVARGALVVATVPGSPAEKSLKPGDTIMAVGEDDLATKSRDEIKKLLEGPAGSSINLIVLHDNDRGEVIEVVRDTFQVPAVEVRRLDRGVGYLRLSQFTPATLEALDSALAAFSSDPVTALVLDLRDNPGGTLDSVRAVAGRFVEGTVWVEVDRDGTETTRSADAEGSPDFTPPDRVVVLVNRGTASAAEILAGALRDKLGAKLIGATTFGKGSIQAVTGLSDQSLLRLTVGHWRTPSGAEVDEKGLQPDIEVALSADDRTAGRDPQLEAALATARGEEVVTDRETPPPGG